LALKGCQVDAGRKQLEAPHACSRSWPFGAGRSALKKPHARALLRNGAWGIGGLDAAVEGLKTSGVNPRCKCFSRACKPRQRRLCSMQYAPGRPFGTAAGARSFIGAAALTISGRTFGCGNASARTWPISMSMIQTIAASSNGTATLATFQNSKFSQNCRSDVIVIANFAKFRDCGLSKCTQCAKKRVHRTPDMFWHAGHVG
jgi:hypothetical protein